MAEKLVLIDGHSILNRAFYGLPDMTNSEGLHTNGVYGFLNIMFRILEEEKPEYLTVAFDVKHPTFRHEMYKEYKGTRKGMPEELREQVPLLKDVLHAMHIVTVECPGLEADDILGTLAKQAEADGMEVSVISGDRDLLQLATEHIQIRIPKTKRGYTEIENYYAKDVLEAYQVTPEHIIDLKGLMGDTADNIPGVPGVGEKTAQKILGMFSSMEELYEHIEEVNPKRIRELLRENREQAMLSKELATIKTDCDFEYNREDALLGELYGREAYQIMSRLEFKSILKRFDAGEEQFADALDSYGEITTEVEWQKWKKELAHAKPELLGMALLGGGAAAGKGKRKSEPVQLSLFETPSDEPEEIYGILGMSICYQAEEGVRAVFVEAGEISPSSLILQAKELLEKYPVAVNRLKDQLHLATPQRPYEKENTPEFEHVFSAGIHVVDVEIGAYLLNPLKDTYQMEDLAREYLGQSLPSYQEEFGKCSMQQALEEKREAFIHYACHVAYVNCMCWKTIADRLDAENIRTLYDTVEMPLVYQLYYMEMRGIQADGEVLKKIGDKLGVQIAALEQEIYHLAGEEFNINSPKQLGVILFEKMKLPFAKKTKTGYSTSADVLEKLRCEDPIIDKILAYRQMAKLKSTYADGLAGFIREDDGRIHGKFNQTITATGRISSTEPNLQNIPIRMEMGRELRKVFVPRDGFVFLDADYSQIELRVLAHMSGDEQLIGAYKEDEDIHRITASKVFHIPLEEVTDLQRRNAKAVNFGIVYGISSFGLGQDLNITRQEAKEYIETYFSTYRGVKAYLDSLVEEGKSKGMVRTMFGRIRPIPELKSSNFMQRSFGERVAMNSPIQGTAADIMKIAMIRVGKRLEKEKLKSQIVLQVHDELLVETWEPEVEQVKKILLEEMMGAADLRVSLDVDVQMGNSWFEAH